MKRHLPPLNALRAFEAAGRLGSFKEAAAELHVTQGAISQHIRLLEDWLGGPLFERRNRRVVLTAGAASYLEKIGPLFQQLSLATIRYGDAGTVAQTLRVNAPATFALRWLIPRLGTFHNAHRDVDIHVDTSNTPLESLREDYDVVIRGGPDTFYGYTMRPFLIDERAPVCSPGLLKRHPLRSPGDLQHHTLLHTDSLPRLWPDWLNKAAAPALRPAGAMHFDHFYLTLQAAIDGLGVAMGPSALLTDDVAAGRLIVPFATPRLLARSYCTYVADEKAQDSLVIRFRAWLEHTGTPPPLVA